jgi:hypothetical protein
MSMIGRSVAGGTEGNAQANEFIRANFCARVERNLQHRFRRGGYGIT